MRSKWKGFILPIFIYYLRFVKYRYIYKRKKKIYIIFRNIIIFKFLYYLKFLIYNGKKYIPICILNNHLNFLNTFGNFVFTKKHSIYLSKRKMKKRRKKLKKKK